MIDILEEHLEEADFLWQQRENALADRVYDLDDLTALEERLLAHLGNVNPNRRINAFVNIEWNLRDRDEQIHAIESGIRSCFR